MRNYVKGYLAISCLLLIFLVGHNDGQTTPDKVKPKERPSTCEYFTLQLDYSILENAKHEDTYIILVFRLGKKEKSDRLNLYRIAKIKTYLKHRGILSKTVITRGTKTMGLGRMDIYIRGKMYETLFFTTKKNKEICVE